MQREKASADIFRSQEDKKVKSHFEAVGHLLPLCYRGYGNGAGQDLRVEDGRGCKLGFNFTKRGFRLSQGVFFPSHSCPSRLSPSSKTETSEMSAEGEIRDGVIMGARQLQLL